MPKKNTYIPSRNTEKAENGTEYYASNMCRLADEYVDNLADPAAITDNTTLFNGMIKYINVKWFRYNKPNYDDIELLNNIWDIYTGLCYKYNKYPTVIEFSLLVGISKDTIDKWKNENTRKYIYYDEDNNIIKDIESYRLNHTGKEIRQELSTSHADAVKKWLGECENNLLRGAQEVNRIGCIFALKANYGYTETAPAIKEGPQRDSLTAAQLPQLTTSGYLELSDNETQ